MNIIASNQDEQRPIDVLDPVSQRYAGSGTAAVSSGVDFGRLVSAARRRKWTIISAIVVGALLGIALALLSSPTYEAEALVEVNFDSVAATNIQEGAEKLVLIDQTFLDTQAQLLRTRSLRERIVRDRQLDLNEEIVGQSLGPKVRTDAAVSWLVNHVEIENPLGTRIFTITVETFDPQLSADIANSYAENFATLNLERQIETTSFARDVLGENLAETRQKLEDSEAVLVAYSRDQGLIQIDGGEAGVEDSAQSLPAASLSSYNQALADARSRRIAAEARLGQAQRLARGATQQNQVLTSQRTEIARLEAEYAQKREVFKPGYPDMVALRSRIEALQSSLGSAAGNENRSRVDVLQAEFQAARGEESQLQEQVAGLRSEVLSDRSKSIQYNILLREVDTNRELYDSLLQRIKEVGVAGGNVENLVSIADSAQRPSKPTGPITSIYLVVGAILGFGLALTWVAFSELLIDRIRRPEDVENKLGLKVLGIIPDIGEKSVIEQSRDPKSEISEAYLALRNQLRFTTGHGWPRTLLVSSALPSEGKSSSAFILANYLKRQGSNVLLIDADLRRPTFKSSAKDEAGGDNQTRPGLVNALIGDAPVESLIVRKEDNADILTSGDNAPNPAELLSSKTFAELLHGLSERYEIVIIDGPPVLGFADSPVIAAMAEATLMIIAEARGRGSGVRAALDRLLASKANVVGAVLTYATASEDGAYGYGYGYGSSYYMKENESEQLGLHGLKRGKGKDKDSRTVYVD